MLAEYLDAAMQEINITRYIEEAALNSLPEQNQQPPEQNLQ